MDTGTLLIAARRFCNSVRRTPVIGLVLALFLAGGCATTRPTGESGSSQIEERWGVRIEGVRLSAADNMLDFRYRVIDPEKALPLLDSAVKPYLVDQSSGARMMVPNPPKVGPLRQTSRGGKPIADRTYFILFANPGKYVKTGNKVTVVIGDFKAENLVVE